MIHNDNDSRSAPSCAPPGNEQLIEQASELEALEAANDKAIRRAGRTIQEMCAVSNACSILVGFFVAWTQVYVVIQPNPRRVLAAAGLALLFAWLGHRLPLTIRRR